MDFYSAILVVTCDLCFAAGAAPNKQLRRLTGQYLELARRIFTRAVHREFVQ